MTDYEKYDAVIKSRLSEHRYIHSVNVSKAAVRLARLNGADEEKAALAGILHDVMKEAPLDVQYEYIEKNGEKLTFSELHNPAVVHQMSGAAFCRLELGITDSDILLPIRYHTTGHANMTVAEKIIYTADFISAERDYPDVGVMRTLAEKSLDEAMIYSIKYTVNKLLLDTRLVHPDTLNCYNYLLESKIKEE